jgi:hypothetical protein
MQDSSLVKVDRCFDAFRHNLHVQGTRKRDDRRQERTVFGFVSVEFVDKGAIHFGLPDLESLQMRQTRIASSEIVDGYRNAT